jgi:hypothetical protein
MSILEEFREIRVWGQTEACNSSGQEMTAGVCLHKMAPMNKFIIAGIALLMFAAPSIAWGQKDKDNEPTSWIYFSVVKDDSGKPVRNAAVVLHPVGDNGKQGRGGLELKTNPEGKADLEGIPYGKLRVQVLAHGYQTWGDDFDVSQAKTEITIKLKRPQGQFSVYDDHAKDPSPKPDTPAEDAKKPN